MTTFFHNGSMGDIIYSIPTVMAMGGGAIYLRWDTHYRQMERLLRLQASVTDVMGPGQITDWNTDVNLSLYRRVARAAAREGVAKHLAVCHMEPHGVTHDLTRPWLYAPYRNSVKPVIVNRSKRYHDREEIDWRILGDVRHEVGFVGSPLEHKRFVKKSGFHVDHIYCNDALDMANVIAGARLFLGNQSLGFAIAEALKVPRVLEVFHAIDNCRPNGPDGHTHFTKEILERYAG